MNILDSIWDFSGAELNAGILVPWVFASWKTNGGNWWASHLCKGKPNFGCATLVRWRVMMFFLYPKDWQLLPLFCKTLCLYQGWCGNNQQKWHLCFLHSHVLLITQDTYKLWSRNIQLSLLQCSITFPRFVPTLALQGCVNNSAGLLVRVLSNSLRGTDWSNPPLWRWGGHMEAKDKGTTWLGFS